MMRPAQKCFALASLLLLATGSVHASTHSAVQPHMHGSYVHSLSRRSLAQEPDPGAEITAHKGQQEAEDDVILVGGGNEEENEDGSAEDAVDDAILTDSMEDDGGMDEDVEVVESEAFGDGDPELVETSSADETLAKQEGAAAAASSAWPNFGVVGETQAALYYSSFLVFTAFMFKNSASGMRGSQPTLRRNGSAE